MDKGDKTVMRSRDELSLMDKKTLCIESASWTKSAIFFSSIGNMSLSRFLVSSDKASLEEAADELISSSNRYSSRLKELLRARRLSAYIYKKILIKRIESVYDKMNSKVDTVPFLWWSLSEEKEQLMMHQ